MTDKPQCIEKVFSDWGPHQCTRRAVRGEFCVQHSPEAVKQRKDKADETFKKHMERINAPGKKIKELEAKIKHLEAIIKTQKE